MVTEDAIVRLIMELIKRGPAGACVIPLINKVDIPGGREKAEKLAHYILSLDLAGIRRVVLCQLRHFPAVKVIVPTGLRRPTHWYQWPTHDLPE
jgi:hypothetical protein